LHYNTGVGTSKEQFTISRQMMVDRQLRARGIVDERVLAAFCDIPRERFVPPTQVHNAYADTPVSIGCDQTISQPYIVAYMVEHLKVAAHHIVLDVGAGSGYQTAILARLCRHVYAIERLEQLTATAGRTLEELGVTNVTLITGDGSIGWTQHAPYDRIIAGAAGPDIPQEWIDQLADGGRIVAPVGPMGMQVVVLLEKQGEKVTRRELCGVRFVRLLGKSGW